MRGREGQPRIFESRQLRETEEHFRSTFENAAVGIAHVARDVRWLNVNQRLCNIVGYTRDELLGLTFQQLTHPDDLKEDLQYVSAVLRGESDGYEMDKRYFHKLGHVVWVHLTVGVQRNDAGDVDYFISVIQDISTRKQAEDEREKLIRLIEASRDFIATSDLKGRISYLNSSGQRLIGVTAGDNPSSLHASDYIPGPWAEFDQMTVIPTVMEKGYWEGEMQFRNLATGALIDVFRNIFLIREPRTGEPWCFATVTRDITEQKLAQKALQESEAFANKVVASSLNGMYLCNLKQGKTVFINPQFTALTGYALADVNSLDLEQFLSLFYPDDRPAVEAHLNALSRGADGEIFDLEYRMKRADGQWMWCFSRDAVFDREPDGSVRRTIGALLDITERKQAEEALHHQAEQLARSNAELQQFAYAASHDLQEPLRMVSIYTDLLGREFKGRLNEKADTFIQYARQGAQRMDALLRDLLAYSRAASGPYDDPVEPVDTAGVIDRVLFTFADRIKERQVEIVLGEMPWVRAREVHVLQILQNLIGNALKYSQEDARLRIEISSERQGSRRLICVKDNGIGIDPAYQIRVFQLFQRLHGYRYSGTGVGLAICQRIVERYGGSIWVESEGTGKGSRFCFTLPGVED
jgi:PAS domain S-box-containing protein